MPVVAAAAVAEEKLVPVCAQSPRLGVAAWRPVKVLTESITITAGFSARVPYVAQSLVYGMGGDTWRFLHMHKHSRWFICSIGGPRARKGDITAVRVLDEIRQKFFAEEDTTEDTTAVAEEIDADVDPMDALDDVAAPVAKPKTKTAKRPRPPRSQVRELTMLKRPPCSGAEQDQTTTIFVYLRPGNRSLYLRVDCLDWLLSYAADEHHFQGVVRDKPEPSPSEGSSAVAEFRVEWDFAEKVWEGEVLVGASAGQSTRCSPDHVTKELWERLNAMSLVEGFYSRCTYQTRRKAAKEFVQLWCAATVRCERDVFGAHWSTPSRSDEPSAKKRRAMPIDAPSAVAESMPINAPSAVADVQTLDVTGSDDERDADDE